VAAVEAMPQSLDYATIAEAQRSCESIEAARDTSLTLQCIPFGQVQVLCYTKGKHPRPVILLGYCCQVFPAFYQQAHLGAKATRRLMRDRVVWTRMHKDINQWVADCQECARSKVTRQPAAVVQPIPVPQQWYSHIHVDIVGPLPVSRDGYRYLFTIIDRSSRMLEAVPLTNVETTTCRDALIRHWIGCFGVPNRATQPAGGCRDGVRAERRPTVTPGAALQRPLQGPGEGTQVLPPRHRRQADSSVSGAIEASPRHSSSNTSSTTAERPPTGSQSPAGNSTSPISPLTIARPSSYCRGQTSMATQTAQQISAWMRSKH
jgi:hypothetical protein